MGGYRFYIPKAGMNGDEISRRLSTSHLFHFSEKFKTDYLPFMIELGRSFVQPAYQTTNRARKGIYALDNLWDGLGAIFVDNPNMRYFFGKVTMYTHFNKEARNLILIFLRKHFFDPESLVTPIIPLDIQFNEEAMKSLFTGDYKKDFQVLSKRSGIWVKTFLPLLMHI